LKAVAGTNPQPSVVAFAGGKRWLAPIRHSFRILHLSEQPFKVNADFVENQVGTLRIVDEQAEFVLVAVDQEAMPAKRKIEPGLGSFLVDEVDDLRAA
jgi:hypothetical protein